MNVAHLCQTRRRRRRHRRVRGRDWRSRGSGRLRPVAGEWFHGKRPSPTCWAEESTRRGTQRLRSRPRAGGRPAELWRHNSGHRVCSSRLVDSGLKCSPEYIVLARVQLIGISIEPARVQSSNRCPPGEKIVAPCEERGRAVIPEDRRDLQHASVSFKKRVCKLTQSNCSHPIRPIPFLSLPL